MECKICEKRCEQTVKIFVKGSDELQLCYVCVVKLRTRKLYYCEERQGYRFNGISKQAGFSEVSSQVAEGLRSGKDFTTIGPTPICQMYSSKI